MWVWWREEERERRADPQSRRGDRGEAGEAGGEEAETEQRQKGAETVKERRELWTSGKGRQGPGETEGREMEREHRDERRTDRKTEQYTGDTERHSQPTDFALGPKGTEHSQWGLGTSPPWRPKWGGIQSRGSGNRNVGTQKSGAGRDRGVAELKLLGLRGEGWSLDSWSEGGG